jgi:hypothetical protein
VKNEKLADEFIQQMRQEMDAAYANMHEKLMESYFTPPPEGWKPPPLTRKQKLNMALWRVRHVLAAPFAWVLSWLDPSRLDRGDD